jgi:hypothetical protein
MAAGAGTPDPGPAPAIPDEEHLRYVAFGKSVLALHGRRVYEAFNPPRVQCACGRLAGECPIRGLADRLGLP